MEDPGSGVSRLRFGLFEADLVSQELFKSGRLVHLENQPFRVLTLFLSRPGELITREELRQSLWSSDTFVEFDSGLNTAITKLRSALNDSADSPTFIQTVPRRGYRFVAPVAGEDRSPFRHPPEGNPTPTADRTWPVMGRPSLFLGVGLCVIAAVLSVGVARLRDPERETSVQGRTQIRVAVLPFENLGTADDASLTEEITDRLRHTLSRLSEVSVVSTASTDRAARARSSNPADIANELGARFLVTAKVRRQKGEPTDTILVTPELAEVSGGTTAIKWHGTVDGDFRDVFQIQREIATYVARALGCSFDAAKLTGDAAVSHDLIAYNAYLRGVEEEDTMAGVRRAAAFFEQAVAIDPSLMEAWRQLSWSSTGLYGGQPTPELAERARSAAEKAISLAPDRPDGYLALGGYQMFVLHDDRAASESFERARQLGARNPLSLWVILWNEFTLGHFGKVIDEAKRLEALAPESADLQELLAGSLCTVGRYAEANASWRRALTLAPTRIDVRVECAHCFIGQGDLNRARAILRAAPKEVDPTAVVFSMDFWTLDPEQQALFLRLTPSAFGDNRGRWATTEAEAYALKGEAALARKYAEEARLALVEQLAASPPQVAEIHSELGRALAILGRKAEAITEAKLATELVPATRDYNFGPDYKLALARVYTRVGESEKALDELEVLAKLPSMYPSGWIRVDQEFAPLRGNPRFQKLLARSD